jgi:hypothetical protein
VHRDPVTVEVALGVDHGVGPRAAEDEVHGGDRDVAHDPPPLARIDELPQVVGGLELIAGVDEELPEVDHVGVVGEGVIGVGVRGPQVQRRQARALNGGLVGAGVIGLGPGGGGDIGVAGGVDHGLG